VPAHLLEGHLRSLKLDAGALPAGRLEELLLVAAALAGDPAAVQHLEREYIAPGVGVVRRLDASPAFLDDVRQQLALKLLTGPRPRLRGFNATGDLLEWIRVAALRTALNLKRAGRRLLVTDDLPVERLLDGGDIEHQMIKRKYLVDFRHALATSLERITPRERTLLRLHFADGVTLDALATMYGVHRATIARWLVGSRRRLFTATRELLGERHRLDTANVNSLYRALRRDLDLSITQLLASQSPSP